MKFQPPVVRADNLVNDVEPPQIKDLQNADPGQKTIAWTPDADIVIVEPARDGPKWDVAVAADDTKIYDNAILEVPPIFPGGMDKFYQYLSKSLRYPPMAAESNIQGKVFVSFVVDKNGMLTDIKVVRSSQIYLLST